MLQTGVRFLHPAPTCFSGRQSAAAVPGDECHIDRLQGYADRSVQKPVQGHDCCLMCRRGILVNMINALSAHPSNILHNNYLHEIRLFSGTYSNSCRQAHRRCPRTNAILLMRSAY
jgi:hypothetical protein